MSATTQVTFYVARNAHGQFCCGETWVDDIVDARLYRTIGPARAAATRWAKAHPEAPKVEVLEWKLDIATATVLDMGAHTTRSLARIERQRQEQEKRDREWRLIELERKEREVAAERERLEGRNDTMNGYPIWRTS